MWYEKLQKKLVLKIHAAISAHHSYFSHMISSGIGNQGHYIRRHPRQLAARMLSYRLCGPLAAVHAVQCESRSRLCCRHRGALTTAGTSFKFSANISPAQQYHCLFHFSAISQARQVFRWRTCIYVTYNLGSSFL
jgi:hypothetical protein